MGKENLIVMAVTPNWEFAAGVTLLSLKQHTNLSDYDVLIYSTSKQEFKGLRRIVPDLQVEAFDFDFKDESRFQRVSKIAFSRFNCFKKLYQYTNVLWLDSDLLILGDISPLLDYGRDGISMFPHSGIPMSVSFAKDVPGFNMEKECFNDGLFVISNALQDSVKIADWCFSATSKFEEYINSDQAVFNLMLQEFNLEVTPLPEKYNCHPNRRGPDSVIVHPWGNQKYWKGLQDPFWDRMYRSWVELGGLPYGG
jgi:lipopolysaccharide biosynthesis glycosyltransferase